MAMQIHGNYAQSKTDYTERVKENQAALRAEKAKEAKETKKAAEGKGSGKLSEPQDVYISSEKSGKEPAGLYRIGQGKPAEVCVGNTDKVDREIEKLKEKKRELEQQIQSASGDERKIQELERKLAQVEQELSQKDNDTYRKQHSEFSRMA